MEGDIGEEGTTALEQRQQENDATATPAVSVSRVNVVPNPSNTSGGSGNINNPPLLPRIVDIEVSDDGAATTDDGGRRENTRLRRKWEFFPGKNRFYCDGRVMTAPSIRFCVLSFALILLTFSLFIVFDAPFLTERLTIAIPIVGSILFVSVIVNMVKTSFSDPGIIPRSTQQETDHLEKSYYSTNFRPPPRTKDIVVNGQVIKSKYCFTCKMFRPPRASHCSVCDNCVDRFDHHCPFLGNCIGKRNYRSFYAFIVSLSFLAVFVLSASIAHLAMLSKEKGNFLMALQESPSSAVVILISFFGMWTVIGLTGFHTYLIAVEQTTNEDIKGLFGRANAKNPFSRGNFCQNCCYVLCGPSQPSLLDPRGRATRDFITSLHKKNDPSNAVVSPVAKIPQLNSVKSSSNNCTNEQQGQGPGHNSLVGGTNKIYREQPPTAQSVQPVQHQAIQLQPSSPQQQQNNGSLNSNSKPPFPLLPAIPPEEKVLLKGQTRNARNADYRQTVPESNTPEEIQMSQQQALMSPSAASTVSLSTVSTSNMSTSNDYDSVHSPLGVGVSNSGTSSNYRHQYQPPPLRNASNINNGNTNTARNSSSTKRLFTPSTSASAEDIDIIDPSDFDDDLDMPSLSNVNEIEVVRRTNNLKGGGNVRNNNVASSNGLSKSTRSLPSTSSGVNVNGGGGARGNNNGTSGSAVDINKIHVLESYPSSSKSSVNSKATASSSGVRSKFGNGAGAVAARAKRSLESTMQNSPLHLDTIM